MLLIKGWNVGAHSVFLDQFEKLIEAVETEKAASPNTYKSGANAKLLAAILKLSRETIPTDPTLPVYRQGTTLGPHRKHWFRAKFGNGRFRLFFRFNSASATLIYVWVNDENTLRTYGSKTDAYRVFSKMLDGGSPPDGWKELLSAAKDENALNKLSDLVQRSADI
jgi:toxin YhaV